MISTPDNNINHERDYLIMPATLNDLNFITDSWCASYAQSSAVLPLNPEIYKVEHRATVALIIARARVAVARPRSHVEIDGRPSKATDILGYCVYHWDPMSKTPIVFWTYVKKIARGHGVARELLANAANVTDSSVAWAPFWTPALKRAEKRSNIMFNPYALTHWAVAEVRKGIEK